MAQPPEVYYYQGGLIFCPFPTNPLSTSLPPLFFGTSHFPFSHLLSHFLILPLPHFQDIFQKSIDTYFFIIFLSLPLFHTRLNTFSKRTPNEVIRKTHVRNLKIIFKKYPHFPHLQLIYENFFSSPLL